MRSSVRATAENCKRASRKLASSTAEQRIAAIRLAAERIEQNRPSLLETNAHDLDDARQMLAGGDINAATFERLRLTDKKIAEMTRSMLAVAELPDPVGRVLQRTELDFNLVLEKITCPALYVKVLKSPFPTLEQAQKMVAMMPRGKLAVLPDSYHHAMFDNPAGLVAILKEFLRDIN